MKTKSNTGETMLWALKVARLIREDAHFQVRTLDCIDLLRRREAELKEIEDERVECGMRLFAALADQRSTAEHTVFRVDGTGYRIEFDTPRDLKWKGAMCARVVRVNVENLT